MVRMIARRFGNVGWRVATLVAVLATGCKSSSMPEARPTVRVNGEEFGGTGGPGGSRKIQPLDETLKSDPCAARLHAISGAMLEYFALNSRLPGTLDELRSLGDLDQPLSFECPETGKSYEYVPGGLQSPDDARQIILVDSTPHSRGVRWAILMQQARGRQPAAMWVVMLSEPVFRGYVPAPRKSNAAATRPAGGTR